MSTGRAQTHNAAGQQLFASYWQAGFEGADHLNSTGVPVDMLVSGGHLNSLDDDYARLIPFGLTTIRESVGWRRSEHRGCIDLSSVVLRARAAASHQLQIAWSIFHYGIPADLTYFSAGLPERFAEFCHRVAVVLAPYAGAGRWAPLFTPVNEISFLAWAVCSTQLMHDGVEHRADAAYELKKNLVRTWLAGMRAIRGVLPDARFIHVDPLIHVVAPAGASELLQEMTAATNTAQFDALRMVAGQLEPGLGGDESSIDIAGFNYYHSNQWEAGTDRRLHWHLNDERRKPLHLLLEQAKAQSDAPLMISETSHVGLGRARWMNHLAHEIRGRVASRHDAGGRLPVSDRRSPRLGRPFELARSGPLAKAPRRRARRRLPCLRAGA